MQTVEPARNWRMVLTVAVTLSTCSNSKLDIFRPKKEGSCMKEEEMKVEEEEEEEAEEKRIFFLMQLHIFSLTLFLFLIEILWSNPPL